MLVAMILKRGESSEPVAVTATVHQELEEVRRAYGITGFVDLAPGAEAYRFTEGEYAGCVLCVAEAAYGEALYPCVEPYRSVDQYCLEV